jgi:hypothetical protein
MDGDPSLVAIVENPASPTVERAKNPGGRPKGSPSRSTIVMRFLLEQIVKNQLPNVDKALNDLLQGKPALYDVDPVTGKRVLISKGTAPNPGAYLTALTGIVDFAMPRLQRIEVKDERVPLESVDIPKDATPEEAQRAYLTLVGS